MSKCRVSRKDFDTYKYIKRLGDGAYGNVKLYNTKDGLRAVKRTIHNGEAGILLEPFIEFDLMRKFSVLNSIVDVYGFVLDPPDKDNRSVYLIMEAMDTDLLKWIKKASFDDRMEMLKLVIKRIGPTISILHKYNIVHNDIKLNNILVNRKDMRCKLTDFGKSNYVFYDDKEYGGLENDLPPYKCNIFHGEYYSFILTLVKIIDRDKMMLHGKEEFYSKYYVEKGSSKLFEGIKSNFIDIHRYLSDILTDDEMSKIPKMFWKFILPGITNRDSRIEDGLEACEFEINKYIYTDINKYKKDIKPVNINGVPFLLKDWHNQIYSYFYSLADIKDKKLLSKYSKAIIILLENVLRTKEFKNNEELFTFQFKLLETIDYNIIYI